MSNVTIKLLKSYILTMMVSEFSAAKFEDLRKFRIRSSVIVAIIP